MSEATQMSPHKIKAMELAVLGGGTAAEVVARANEYHKFLIGGASQADSAAKATADKAKSEAAAKAKAVAAADKAKAEAEAKAKAEAEAKAKAAPKADAKKTAPAAAGAAATPPPGDTKAPDGVNTYDDVVAALQSVMRAMPNNSAAGRKIAYDILDKAGNGAKNVRDLKPTLYDAVVAGCKKAVANTAAKPVAAKTVAVDELGQPIDTSGASATTVGEDDPPEGGSGEDI